MGILRHHSNHTAAVATDKIPLSQRIRVCIRQHSPVRFHRHHHHHRPQDPTSMDNNDNGGGGGPLPSLEISQSQTTELQNNTSSSIFERRPSTSDKPTLSVSTVSAKTSPSKRQSFLPPMIASLTVKTDFTSEKQKHTTPHFLNLSPSALGSKFIALRNHEQTLRTMPNTLLYHPVVLSRNRYSDVYPWEHHRINLHSLQFGYINASPIALRTANGSGEEQENYIATQGPRDNGYDGGLFWEMCWQENVEVVVMLTRPVEEGKEKCGVYYAEDVEEVKRIGEWEVRCVGKEEEGGTVRRTLKLRRVGRAARSVSTASGASIGNGTVGTIETVEEHSEEEKETEIKIEELQEEEAQIEERTIHHFLFESWPDNDIPQSPADIHSLLTLLDVSRAANNHSITPRVVHCSAGVGRTGTFIALDHLLRELDMGHLDGLSKDKDPVLETVKRLRDQRMLMVHKVAQYVMIYNVLKEKWLEREREKSSKDKEGEEDTEVEIETPGGGSARKRKLGGLGSTAEDGRVKLLHT
ncbi:hypothetical protein sscle_07g055450 [Sclerotinia sclerotiorum 1980 UF-70]|uniref:Uncharacterized protein n=1 Tax=Sclerotinia sclerotiorum (strain ATCC 18683 / 1980 / Ss-1) TaxID=665079 RepID=A0A1D9Q770_SCLS1|nr:hypothetical protein sscle_07g055450 [Sclerotinia sclerotiorum 1980 UF-70]